MKLAIDRGGDGEGVSFDGEVLHMIVDRAFAPGAPIKIIIDGASLDAKTIVSKRRDDGRFDVRVRLRNLRRDDRAKLDRLTPLP